MYKLYNWFLHRKKFPQAHAHTHASLSLLFYESCENGSLPVTGISDTHQSVLPLSRAVHCMENADCFIFNRPQTKSLLTNKKASES